MTKNRHGVGAGLAMLIAVAGTVVPAAAQEDARRDRDRAAQPSREQRAWNFRSAEWLLDRDVQNENDEEIAEVDDFILDRGSGRIDYVVLSTGTILGLGGKKVAVSYSALRWAEGGEHFVLPLTTEQLKEFPEFSEDEWKGLAEGREDGRLGLRNRLVSDAAATSRDPYADSLQDGRDVRVKGEITKVERRRHGEYGEHVVITVRDEDGNERKIALGPSWFVNSGVSSPMRGDEVTVETVTIPRDPDRLLVARKITVKDRELVLRTDDRHPTWVLGEKDTPERRQHAGRRYLLLSKLDGARVDCRGTECGKVDDTIIEGRTGHMAFLSIDPNENFLGIADTKRLVPWTITSVAADGTVRVDASKEMVLASPETPSDITSLNSGGMVDTVYRAFEVDAPEFEMTRGRGDQPLAGRMDAWSRDGDICKGIKKDTLRTMNGKSTGMRDVELGAGVPAASAVVLDSDGEEVLVLLGPAWYMKNQNLPCKSDAQVTAEAYRTTIGGKDYWLARSIRCDGSRVVLIQESGEPAWDRR